MQEDDGAPASATHPLSRSLVRRARLFALALAVLYGFYLVAGNLLVNSRVGLSLANRQPEKFVAAWNRAWTLYPGHVHVEGLAIAGHVRRTVWSVQADTATGRIALLPLLARELRVPRVNANGLTGGATMIDVLREPPPPRPGGWTMRFERIVGEGIRHACLNDLVLKGVGRAELGFVKVLRGGPMEVLPSQASWAHGTVWRDGRALARDTTVASRSSGTHAPKHPASAGSRRPTSISRSRPRPRGWLSSCILVASQCRQSRRDRAGSWGASRGDTATSNPGRHSRCRCPWQAK